MKNSDVADLLRRFVSGDVDPYEFDDFTSSRKRNERLEAYRQELLYLPDSYPPDEGGGYCNASGIARILEIADELESPEATAR